MTKFVNVRLLGISAALSLSVAHGADSVVVEMHLVAAEGVGEAIGTVTATQRPYGTLLTPSLGKLTPGVHGFHVHENPDCRAKEKDGNPVPGLAAGGHYDPTGAGTHQGPFGEGHLGDLPALVVDAEGNAAAPVLAPRIRVADLRGRALMIHAGGDNYSDMPEKLGGGGARMACGVVE